MFILRCNLTGSAERPPRRLRTACFKCGEHGPPDGPCSHPLAACLRLHRRAVQRSPRGYTRCAGRGTCWISKLPHRGGAAVVPAVPSRSSTATRPAMQVSARPRTAIIMLHPGRRRPWLASAAHVQSKLHMLSQAQGSRPGPPTDRNRRAFPHGKACPGRGASLLPAWCTAVRPWARSGRVPGPAPRQDGRPAVSPGTGRVVPTQLAGPGPMAVLLQCV